jgi:hypothetical protein
MQMREIVLDAARHKWGGADRGTCVRLYTPIGVLAPHT